MKRTKVESSNITSIGYNPQKTLLEIEFNNGSIYQYHPVTEAQHKELMAASSQGSWFYKNIRSNGDIKSKNMTS